MNGYSRYAATAVWVGNANKELVRDGPAANYASADTTIHLYKNWMSAYHAYLQSKGVFTTLANFDSLQPPNVAQRQLETATTNFGLPGGCSQTVLSWVRTDVQYASECETKEIDSRNGLLASDQTPPQFRVTRQFVKLPAFKPDLAVALAQQRGIPIAPTQTSQGVSAVTIASPGDGATISGPTAVSGSADANGITSWKLEIGSGGDWQTIGSGKGTVSNGPLGQVDASKLKEGGYTIRLTASSSSGDYMTSINVTVKHGSATPTGTPKPGSSGSAGNGNGGDSGGGSSVTPQTPKPGTPSPDD
jgi:hypothetical protein